MAQARLTRRRIASVSAVVRGQLLDGAADSNRESEQVELEGVACNLCGARTFTPVYLACPDRLFPAPGRFDVVRCGVCDLMQTNPRPTSRAIETYYPSSYQPFCVNIDPDVRRRLWRGLRAVVDLPYRLRYGAPALPVAPAPPHNKLLDIGCGAGGLLLQMTRRGWEPWGIEPNERAAANSRELLAVPESRIFIGVAEDAQLPADTFELITLSHTLEHMHDPLLVLAKVHRWLAPSGRVRIWVPNAASWESKLFGRLWFGLDVPRHLYHFTPKTIRALLERSGFAVERIVPQARGHASSLAGSVTHLATRAFPSAAGSRTGRKLYYASIPLSTTSLALGNLTYLDVTAMKA